MNNYILEIDDGSILGSFSCAEDAERAATEIEACTRVQKITRSEVIDCHKLMGSANLYRVNIGCQTLYIEAVDPVAALVSGVNKAGYEGASLEVVEYELPKETAILEAYPTKTYCFSEASIPLLKVINAYNLDFVALALSYAMEAEDVAELRDWEAVRTCFDYSSPLALSSDELRRRIRVWHFPTFIEETDASPEIYSLYKSFERIENSRELLAFSYLFEQWAGYDCTYPYTLYSLLVSGDLDEEIKRLDYARKLLS